jgi:hypothetical protein
MNAPPRRNLFPTIPHQIAGRSHFTIERWGAGWAITIRRRGCPVETILAKTQGEVNRQRLDLSSQGLVGFIGGAA